MMLAKSAEYKRHQLSYDELVQQRYHAPLQLSFPYSIKFSTE